MQSKSTTSIFIYLLIAFGFSWLLWVPKAMISQGTQVPDIFQPLVDLSSWGAYGPLVGAVCLVLYESKLKGLKSLFGKLLVKFNGKWLVPTFVMFPIAIGIPLLIVSMSGQEIVFPEEVNTPFILPIVFLVILLNAGPLQEEFGWRGILQDRLQNSKLNALYSSIVVGLIWGIWHLPLFFMPDQGFYYEKPIWGLLLSTTLISIMFTWLYNNTNKSMLVVLFFHAMFNFSHYIFPTLSYDPAGLYYFAILIVMDALIVWKYGTNLKLNR